MPSGPAFPPLFVSIIIPTFNEQEHIGRLLAHLRTIIGPDAAVEIVVADGGSTDETVAEAAAHGARVVQCPRRGRAAQLNHGAAHATGQLLYFLHADSLPPATLLPDLRAAVASGAAAGCYRLRFDEPHWFLVANAWFTRFNFNGIRYGDQSLFVRREVFEQAGGYREKLQLLEDQEIVGRLRQHGPFRVLPGYIITSARKYRRNGVYRLQGVFALLTGLFWLGVPQPRLVQLYKWLVRG
ncbi:TIGR04283 family arsenosugar biosynthesis glycosyltransferase [Hymenobacter lapidiphilus]|uniref:TIGR04283 family arsenosugar biosynthesis glycosyltransferase n=1 Tax=Hymenobacter lapidiphilus TaxID=2608003 RepID=A0A7Y7U5J3_9BACT|nr:TIGR04283 family arsenosugar biosynthesis glycosyltransferase [Hymenobacter lapidiphilus]NVO31786.1 TIGR04283 family arsenosugar biosynthesis glycosyltransferase [Hymenobacter lapidiphilus]